MHVPAPHPPAAPRTLAVPILAALALWFPNSGCYEGPKSSGVPWYGDSDDDGDDADTDTADDGDAGSGGDDGPAADDGGPSADDGGPAADDGAPADDGGSGGIDDGGAMDDGGSADTGDAGDDGAVDDGAPPPADVPDNAYCDEVSAWQPEWVQLEDDVLELVNQFRAQGANCGSEGSFGPAGPLTMNPALRCAARKHSKDMNDRSFFDHTNPSGESPWDRMGKAGYNYSAAGENIAGGSDDAAGTMDQWMGSDGHCANIMSPDFEEIGVGYYPGGQWGTLWTQAFGSP
jgi:uncharacterized protein YkwD